ncbi:hypothetical protein E4T49_00201 [Aureobasidium sp. EXF-10728]|nr:hypothetical protein E4T49_00201 [Aureobasidium sp. EXF-10728]
MLYKNLFAVSSLLSLATAAPKGFLSKRIEQDEITWGPLIGLGPTANGIEITGVVATIYPGDMPKTQAGGLYNWIGINNETESGDLVQGIVGSYSRGESECKGAKADSLWCISAEVYGWDTKLDKWNQYVGEERMLAATPEDGITFNYTLVDQQTGLWYQTARNARTGALYAEYQKTSPTMTMVNTAVECQSCTPPTDVQYWKNITIKLSGADKNFGSTLYQSNNATNTKPFTNDNGKTWKIQNVTIPVVPPVADVVA